MKVIQIIDNLCFGGGVNSFVFDLCFALKDAGSDVYLIGILEKGASENPVIADLESIGIHVVCVGSISKKTAILQDIPKLRKIIKEIAGVEPTVCNLHLKLSVLMGSLATIGLKNVKCVETYHNTYHHYHLQCWTLRPFIKKYICVSETARQEMKRRFYISDRYTVAIPNGVSRKKIREMSGIDQLLHKDDITRIVSVGRLSYEKNFKVAVQAFSEICNEKLTYTLVGGGPEEEEIRALAAKNQFIVLLGSQTRVRALQELALADVVVMPSLWEGRSILQLEAMALDKPMILSDAPGLREPLRADGLAEDESIHKYEWGYLVKTNDYIAYRDAVLDFINGGINLKRKIITQISEENDMVNVAQKYLREYEIIFSQSIR